MLNVPVTPNSDGSVRLEITALRPEVVRSYILEAVPPTPTTDAWTWPSTGGDAAALESGTATSAADLAGTPITELALRVASGRSVTMNSSADDTLPTTSAPDAGDEGGANSDEVVDQQLDTAATTTGTMAAIELAQAADEEACSSGLGDEYWKWTGETTRRKVPVHTDYLANNLNHKFEWSTSNRTELSVIYAGTGTNYNAGLSHSNVNRAGFTDTLGEGTTDVNHVWNAVWEYDQQEKFCYNAGYPYSMGKKRWLPYTFTGFNRVSNNANRWACNSQWRGQINIPAWVSQETSVTFSGWFSIAGVAGVSMQQTHENSHVATYVFKKNKNVAVLCGKGGYPADVPFVEEMTKA